MEEIRIASVYFRASRLLRASAISSRASYFASREVARLHNVTMISPVFCARRHFSLFIFILPSLCIPFTIALRSHLCHPCIVFTSHAAYIILTSVARGNVRHFFVFLPNFYVFFTYFSRNLPRERTPMRCNLNNYTTRAMKSKIGELLIPKYHCANLRSLDCNFYRTKQS